MKNEEAREDIRAEEHYELFRFLMGQYCLQEENIESVPDIKSWCEEHGMEENEEDRPLKIVMEEGACKLLVRENLSGESLERRMNALRMRGQMIKQVPYDWADMLDDTRKKLAYLFLKEYARTLPGINEDQFREDEWAMGEMKRLTFIRS